MISSLKKIIYSSHIHPHSVTYANILCTMEICFTLEAAIIIILLWLLRDCLAFPFSKTTIAILCVEAKGCWVKQ